MQFISLFLPLMLATFVSSQDGDLELMAEGGASAAGGVNVINLAGIYDTTVYTWSPEIFEVTVDLINQGWWGALPNTDEYRLEYSLENSNWYVLYIFLESESNSPVTTNPNSVCYIFQ